MARRSCYRNAKCAVGEGDPFHLRVCPGSVRSARLIEIERINRPVNRGLVDENAPTNRARRDDPGVAVLRDQRTCDRSSKVSSESIERALRRKLQGHRVAAGVADDDGVMQSDAGR